MSSNKAYLGRQLILIAYAILGHIKSRYGFPEMKGIIAIIPARGGSKGVVKKNLRHLHGKPLIYYTIHAAQQSKIINQIVVSSDDNEILNVAQREGAEIIRRPIEISGDSSSTIDAVLHVINVNREQGNNPKVIALLQPTSPLRTTNDIDAALDIFSNNECDSVISVVASSHPPFWTMIKKNTFLLPLFDQKYLKMRRQDLPKTYHPNGAIFIASVETIQRTRSFFGKKTKPYIMPNDRSIDIDSEFDFFLAESLMKYCGGYD